MYLKKLYFGSLNFDFYLHITHKFYAWRDKSCGLLFLLKEIHQKPKEGLRKTDPKVILQVVVSGINNKFTVNKMFL